jgi:hypothetical protein
MTPVPPPTSTMSVTELQSYSFATSSALARTCAAMIESNEAARPLRANSPYLTRPALPCRRSAYPPM